MLAALALALQKFNIQARRIPGFEEKRPPTPRRKPQPGRKLTKRLRHSNDSDRSRPTSPESGSYYTPQGSLTSSPLLSPLATPPQSPSIARKTYATEAVEQPIVIDHQSNVQQAPPGYSAQSQHPVDYYQDPNQGLYGPPVEENLIEAVYNAPAHSGLPPIDIIKADYNYQAQSAPPPLIDNLSHDQQVIPSQFAQPQQLNNTQEQYYNNLASALAKVQEFFDRHPEKQTASNYQLFRQLSTGQLDTKKIDKVLLDQLAKDHHYLLKKFLDQQESSDDESLAEEAAALRKSRNRRQRGRRVDTCHSTTQTEDNYRPLRLPLVEDLVVAQTQKRALANAPSVPPKTVCKAKKAAISYQQLVLELEPLVTPVSALTAASEAPPFAGGEEGSKASLWKDVWGSWGVWLIARFSATGFGGDVDKASSITSHEYSQRKDKDICEEARTIATMPGPTRDLSVNLYRDTLNTPWGFRLQGGVDFKQPLTVQRVFVGSPADSNLQRGDVIVRIGNHDVMRLLHKQAQDLVKAAGGDLNMVVKRGSQDTGYNIRSGSPQLVIVPSGPDPSFGGFRSRPSLESTGALGFVPTLPKQPRAPMQSQANVPSFGVDYRRGGFRVDPTPRGPEPKSMLNRLNQSLTQSLWTPEDGEEWDYKPVSQMKATFDSVNHEQQAEPPVVERPSSRTRIDIPHPQPDYADEDDDEVFRGVNEIKKKYSRQVKAHEREMELKKPFPADARVREPKGPHKPIWQKPASDAVPCGLSEPGWTPGSSSNKQSSAGWSPVRAPSDVGAYAPGRQHPQPVPVNRPRPVPVNRPQPAPVNHPQPAPVNRYEPSGRPAPINRRQQPQQVPQIDTNDGSPAWYGSLRGGGGVRPWEVRAAAETMGNAEMLSPRPAAGPTSPRQQAGNAVHSPRVQQMSYGPAGQEYRQLAPGESSDNAQVKHLQYNTPLGLYSKTNAQDVLHGQTAGKPGEGTLQMTGTGGPGGPGAKKEFDPSRSEVLALLQAEERSPRHHQQQQQPQVSPSQRAPPAQQSARYTEERPTYQGYVDHSKQSPSMHALEAHVEQDLPGGGFSDF